MRSPRQYENIEIYRTRVGLAHLDCAKPTRVRYKNSGTILVHVHGVSSP